MAWSAFLYTSSPTACAMHCTGATAPDSTPGQLPFCWTGPTPALTPPLTRAVPCRVDYPSAQPTLLPTCRLTGHQDFHAAGIVKSIIMLYVEIHLSYLMMLEPTYSSTLVTLTLDYSLLVVCNLTAPAATLFFRRFFPRGKYCSAYN